MKNPYQKLIKTGPGAGDTGIRLETVKVPFWTGHKKKETANLSGAFWVLVQKEISDHMRSWRSIILFAIIALTCLASLYTAISSIKDASPSDLERDYLFLKLFTMYKDPIPPYITFIGFLGPLLGIALGFDAINSERNKGTLSRLLSQPIPRDYVINAKFVGALSVISFLFFALGFLVMGIGLLVIGIPPTAEEFWRMIFFIIISIVYVAFWLNLAILFSVRFKQAATSALSCIAIWIFFSVFFDMLISLIGNAIAPDQSASADDLLGYSKFMHGLSSLSPNELFSEATSTLLTPSIRTLGPLTMSQVYGAVPSPLSLGQSILIVWPQLTGLMAATIICFGLSYLLFMRQEIRSRS
ncbi:MAG: ABC transporter permease [Tuberibacillus sp.]